MIINCIRCDFHFFVFNNIGLDTTNEKMSSTEDKLVSTTTSDIPPPPYENITFSFDSTPKCLSVEANSSFV